MIATWATLDLIDQCLMSLVTNDSYLGYLISGMFGLISGMFGLISGMFLNKSSIEQGMRYSCYPLVVVFNILSWYRFHCRGMTQHLLFHLSILSEV